MSVDIGFQVPSRRGASDGQEVEHEFGHGAGGCTLFGFSLRGIEPHTDSVSVAVFGTKCIRKAAQVETMAEKMLQHGHAVGSAILENDDGEAGGRHPPDEPFEMGKPFVGWNVIQGVRTEYQVARGRGAGFQNRGAHGIGLGERALKLREQMHIRFNRDGALKNGAKDLVTSPVPAPASMDTFRVGRSSTSFCKNRLAFRF